MDLGWLLIFGFCAVEMLIVLLLVMPMPSNHVRGAITGAITHLWDKQEAIRYIAIGFTIINALYFWTVVDALTDPFKAHFGFLVFDDPLVTCEMRAAMFERERNAYVTGFSLFLFLVLRRLVDIQQKLHEARADSKSAHTGVPMGAPVGHGYPAGYAPAPPAKPRSKFD